MKGFLKLTTLCTLSASFLLAGEVPFDAKILKERSDMGYKSDEKLEYKIPDEKTIPNNQFGDMVRYGKELIVHTSKYIGPEVNDPKMRYAGNNLNCQSCHLDAGTKPYSSSYIGIYAAFPQYNARGNNITTLSDRINGCMERSMNGKALPLESKEIKAIQTYMFWLSERYPIAGVDKLEGRSLDPIDRKMIKEKAADPEKGKIVYEQQCASCHGSNSEGVKNEGKANGYMYPPLWGKDSYNKGAGMYRILKAADFIKSNMPLGATKENPILTDEEAYNVAAFINMDSHFRADKANRVKDFPDEIVKAPDVYRPSIESKEHQFGPFGKLIK